AALGTPPEGRLAGRRREWERFWRIVEEKLASVEAELDLQQAAEIARAAPSCLLCYEADWRVCHRRRIAEILAQRRGFTVHHLAVRNCGTSGPPSWGQNDHQEILPHRTCFGGLLPARISGMRPAAGRVHLASTDPGDRAGNGAGVVHDEIRTRRNNRENR